GLIDGEVDVDGRHAAGLLLFASAALLRVATTAASQGADEGAQQAEAATNERTNADAAAQERHTPQVGAAENRPGATQPGANNASDITVLERLNRRVTKAETSRH